MKTKINAGDTKEINRYRNEIHENNDKNMKKNEKKEVNTRNAEKYIQIKRMK